MQNYSFPMVILSFMVYYCFIFTGGIMFKQYFHVVAGGAGADLTTLYTSCQINVVK